MPDKKLSDQEKLNNIINGVAESIVDASDEDILTADVADKDLAYKDNGDTHTRAENVRALLQRAITKHTIEQQANNTDNTDNNVLAFHSDWRSRIRSKLTWRSGYTSKLALASSLLVMFGLGAAVSYLWWQANDPSLEVVMHLPDVDSIKPPPAIIPEPYIGNINSGKGTDPVTDPPIEPPTQLRGSVPNGDKFLLREISSIYIDPQTAEFQQKLYTAIIKQLQLSSLVSYSNNIDQASGRLRIRQRQTNNFIFELIGGSQIIWSMERKINSRSSDVASQMAMDLIRDLTTAIQKAKKSS